MLKKIVLGISVLSLSLIVPLELEARSFNNYGNYSTEHTPSVHQFSGAFYDVNNDYIQIEDGSHWQINPRDYYTLKSWQPGDIIELLVNFQWFMKSKYNYRIHNLTRYTADIEANLMTAPVTDGAYTHWIYAFDKKNKTIFLNDGSSWKVDDDDAHILNKWNGNDLIIIGKIYYLFSVGNYVLINVNHNEYVPVESQ